MSKTNLFPVLSDSAWVKGYATSSAQFVETLTLSGYSGSWTGTSTNDFVYFLDESGRLNGRTLELSYDKIHFSDGMARLQVRIYTGGTYTEPIDNLESDGEVPSPGSVRFTVPDNATSIRVYIRHETVSGGTYAAATMEFAGLFLWDILESAASLTFGKFLQENLPATVTPTKNHVFFTSDGATRRMYVSNKLGKLVEIASSDTYYNPYTQAWIDERKAEILALQRAGHCVVFVTPTDIHVRDLEDGNAGRYDQMRDLIMVCEQLPIDYVLCEGDIMSYCALWETYEPRLEKVRKILDKCRAPWYMTRGNHDYNSDDSDGDSNDSDSVRLDTIDTIIVTSRDWHNSVTAKLPVSPNVQVVFDEANPTKGYFYVDDYANKHRIIYANSNESYEDADGTPYTFGEGEFDFSISGACVTKHQIQWLVDKAMDMTGKTDWVVSFHSHIAPYTDAGSGDTSEFHGYGSNNAALRSIVKAFQDGTALTNFAYNCLDVTTHAWGNISITKNFAAQGAIQVIGWFAGHIHADCYRKVDGLNVCVSVNSCASQRTSWQGDLTPVVLPPARDDGQYAMSLNVWIVNKTTRTVNMIKLGSKENNSVKTSSDLTFTY
jgi:hypothetical protein